MVELGSTEITRETGHMWAANSSTNSHSQVRWTGRWGTLIISHFLSQWGEPGRGWEETAISIQCPSKRKVLGKGEAGMGRKEQGRNCSMLSPEDLSSKIIVSVKQQLQNSSKLKKACLGPPSAQIIRETILSDTFSISAVPWITELYSFSWHFLSWVTQAIAKLTYKT